MMNEQQALSKETLRALEELGKVLAAIHKRLIQEGYVIIDGQIYKPTEIQAMEDLGS